jgi:hypothetical protein
MVRQSIKTAVRSDPAPDLLYPFYRVILILRARTHLVVCEHLHAA